MPDILSYREWIDMTEVRGKPRGADLKKLDVAVEQYGKSKSPADRDLLRKALTEWTTGKGADWKSSIRNVKYQTIEILEAQLLGTGAPTAANSVAIARIRQEANTVVTELFRGKKLVWREVDQKEQAKALYKVTAYLKKAKKNVGALLPGGGKADAGGAASGLDPRSLLDPILDGVEEFREEVLTYLEELAPDFLRELALEIAPYIGTIRSGRKAIKDTAKAIKLAWEAGAAEHHAENLQCVQSVHTAIRGLGKVLEREAIDKGISAARAWATFGTKLAGDLGGATAVATPVVGLANAAIELAQLVTAIVMNLKECRVANEMMEAGEVDPKVFLECPVVGCYLICCVPTSAFVTTFFESVAAFGWTHRIDSLVVHDVRPLKEQARRAVLNHRFWIEDLQAYPGIMQANKNKLKAMLKAQGKSDLAQQHASVDDPEVVEIDLRTPVVEVDLR